MMVHVIISRHYSTSRCYVDLLCCNGSRSTNIQYIQCITFRWICTKYCHSPRLFIWSYTPSSVRLRPRKHRLPKFTSTSCCSSSTDEATLSTLVAALSRSDISLSSCGASFSLICLNVLVICAFRLTKWCWALSTCSCCCLEVCLARSTHFSNLWIRFIITPSLSSHGFMKGWCYMMIFVGQINTSRTYYCITSFTMKV